MLDFLSFRTFITPSILITFYYIGAVLIPLIGWSASIWIKRRYFPELVLPKRFYIYAIFAICFFCAELFWRMIFEFMIAYFDMHDALMRMSAL